MNLLGYLLMSAGCFLDLVAAATYSHFWIGISGRSVEMWKPCAALGVLLIVLGLFFGKARS